ncbi:MAG: recombination-associated protein RdgC [Pseudomonadota bacterium]|nr:recombination-associated protein RdgC [Pseudomonadota bacterium]
MWLKSIKAFKVTPPHGKTEQDWKEALARQISKPCPPDSGLAYGWSSAFKEEGAELVASVSGFHKVDFIVSKRLLPQDVIKQTVADRVAELELSQGVSVSKKEQRRMQDEVHFELLPKAFVQQKSAPVCWCPESNLLLVGTTQTAMIEHLVTCWAKCLPGWKLKPIQTETPPERKLTAWMKGDERLPDGLTWGESCQLVDPQDRYCTIRFNGNELTSHTVIQHLKDGMSVKQAALIWQEKIRFTLSEGCVLSALKPIDIDKEYEEGQSKAEQIAMDLALMAPLYHACLNDVLQACDGLPEKAEPVAPRAAIEVF